MKEYTHCYYDILLSKKISEYENELEQNINILKTLNLIIKIIQ